MSLYLANTRLETLAATLKIEEANEFVRPVHNKN